MFFHNVLKGKQEWYLYFVSLVLVGLAYILGQFPMTVALLIQMQRHPDIGSDAFEKFQSNPDFSLFHIDQNFGFVLILMIFVFATIALIIGVKGFHKRPFKSLISWSEKIDWGRILWGFGIWMIFALASETITYILDPAKYTFTSPDWSFLILLLIAAVILPIQTSFEEFLFRGYLMQAIGSFARNKLVALFLTSILFVLMHGMNPEIEEYGLWKMIPYYLVAGFFLGYITIMDDRLELALGVHAATNMFGALFVTYEGAAIQTATLFKTSSVDPIVLTIIFFILALIFIMLAHKKYRWDSPFKVFTVWESPPYQDVASDE